MTRPQRIEHPGNDWQNEFVQELEARNLARVHSIARVLIVVEAVLIGIDFTPARMQAPAWEGVLIWRIVLVSFLALYLTASHFVRSPGARLRLFLGACLLFAPWISLLLAEASGDMSVFCIAVLSIAALCPLASRFNKVTFIASTIVLSFGLVVAGHPRLVFWLVNIITACILAIVIERLCYGAALTEFQQRKALDVQKQRVDQLLYNVFPETVANALKEGQRSVALHSEVTILFADVAGFTSLASRILPSQLVEMLERLFDRFDRLATQYGVEKIKTIGDAYMAITGAPVEIDRREERMADFALAIVDECARMGAEAGFDLALRVGIHSGPVVAGVIGSSRLCYDLWGDSVNVAQRLEAHGEPNVISVSEPVYHRLRHAFVLDDRGLLDLKGRGPTRTFILRGRREAVAAGGPVGGPAYLPSRGVA